MGFDKPAGYDEIEAGNGDFTPIQLGGHKLVIKSVEVKKAGNGNSYIRVMYDTAPDDIQPNYYMEQYRNDTRNPKKWGGVVNVFPTDQEGRTSKTFKQFCTSIEKSNNCKIQWGANFEGSIVSKVIGGVFGEEEYYNSSNEIKTARKLFWWRSIEGLKDAKIPDKRTVEISSTPAPAPSTDFVQIPSGFEELPFM